MQMTKQSWYNIHSWVGIKLAVLACFILVTGTLAVMSHEIDWLANPAMRVSPASDSGETNWQQLYHNARQRRPDDKISWIAAPLDPWFAAEVVRITADGQRYRQFFHPVTAEYQGEGRWYNWQRFFRMTHRHLMLPTQIGITIVCLYALFMVLSMLSGTVIYPKWWRGFFRRPRRQNARVFWNDIHRLCGLWSLWLLLVICLTSLWYLVEIWGGRADYPEIAKPQSPLAQQTAVQPSAGVFAEALRQTRHHHPQLDIRQIRIPSRQNQVLTILGQDDTLLVRDRANNTAFDPVSGELVSMRRAGDLSLHVRISEAADPLHFGSFGGLYSKVVYFLFGIVLSALAITGTYLYGLRYTRIKRGQSIAKRRVWQAAWHGMAWGKWFSLKLLTICLGLTGLIFTGMLQ